MSGEFFAGLSAVLGEILQHSRIFQDSMDTSQSSRITTSLLL